MLSRIFSIFSDLFWVFYVFFTQFFPGCFVKFSQLCVAFILDNFVGFSQFLFGFIVFFFFCCCFLSVLFVLSLLLG